MSEIERILHNCSAWELAELRRMGLRVPGRIRPSEVCRRIELKPTRGGRRDGGGRKRGSGIAVVSDQCERWGSIGVAAEALKIGASSVRRAVRDGKRCVGRILRIEGKAA